MFKFIIDDKHYLATLPPGYISKGRLVYRNNKPGVMATNPQGKERFIPARQPFYGKKV